MQSAPTFSKLLEINKSSISDNKSATETSSTGNTHCCWGLPQPAKNCKFKTSLPRFHNGRNEPKTGTSFAPAWVFASLKHHPAVRKTKHCSHFRIKRGGRRAEYHGKSGSSDHWGGDILNFSLSFQTSLHPSVAHHQAAGQG